MTVASTRKFQQLVAPYLEIQGTTKTWKAPDIEQGIPNGAVPLKITNIERIPRRHSVYDIEVNQNHNFLVNNLVAHNSRLELSLDLTTTLLMAFTYNREMFKTNYPEQVLTVSGDYDKEGLAAFKQQILGEAGGPGNNWRLPVIPAGDIENFKIESVKLRESPKDMLFDQMIELAINLKAAAYGCHPSTLNLTAYSGTSGQNTLGGNNTSGEIEFSKEHGLIPSLLDMCEWLTDAIIHPRYDDLKLVLIGLQPEDEKQAMDIRAQRVSKYITRNEARMEEGFEALGDVKDMEKNLWNFPADVPCTNYMSVFQQADQAEQEQQQGGQDDQGDSQDQQQDDGDQYYKSLGTKNDLQKSQPEVKYLRITLE